jgi:hypothetical protein
MWLKNQSKPVSIAAWDINMYKFTEIDFLNQLLKNAQAASPVEAPAAPVNPELISNVAKKLINRLSAPAGTSDSPLLKDLTSFSNLLNYLGFNKVTDQGQQIVYPFEAAKDANGNPNFQGASGKGAEFGKLPSKEKEGYLPYPAQNPAYYVNKQGLITYLQNKQRQAVQEPNELLAAMIGSRIDDANQELQLNISKDAPIKPDNKNELDPLNDDVDLDRISNPLLLDNPLSSSGNVDVKGKDLKSTETFHAFIQTLKIKKDGKVLDYQFFTDDTYCDVIGFLFARANSKYFRDRAKYNKYYLDLITNLAKEYNCSVGGSKVHPPTDKADSSQDYKPVAWKSGQPLPPEVQKEIVNMRYPLLSDRLDFRWIQEWLNSYVQIEQKLGGYLDPNASKALQIVETLLNQDKSMQSLNDTAIAIYRDRYQWAVQLVPRTQAIHAPLSYLKSLASLMTYLTSVLQNFKHDFWYNMPPEWQADFNTQINDTTNSYAEKAILQIGQWINNLPAAQTKVDKEIGGLNG